MLLVIAVFGVVAAKTLIAQPEMVFPTFAIIPVSVILGWCIYKKNLILKNGLVDSGVGGYSKYLYRISDSLISSRRGGNGIFSLILVYIL
ncbi:MAG: hypothetical protein Ct9H300mP23_07530 [Nitrospinota bacterium]|nr:MAG: hypothetical protein Ct9H300mP23_07530 [Nitrospinota bacterium]